MTIRITKTIASVTAVAALGVVAAMVPVSAQAATTQGASQVVDAFDRCTNDQGNVRC